MKSLITTWLNLSKKAHLAVGAVLVIAAMGAYSLHSSRAAGAFLSLEPETGTISGPAARISDTTASSGQALQFKAVVTPTPSPSPSPSGEAMPVGDLTGWKQVLAEDFTKAATTSTFDSTYASSWCGYDDGTGGKYYKVISATGGMMRFNLDGTRGGAGSFGPPATCWGGLYGKYTMRFKVTGAGGYGAANMVWPSSNIWGDGEVDYPEGNFGGTMHMFQHGVGCTDCSANIAHVDTGQHWTSWHTASTEWTPSGVRYFLDGREIANVTTHIPRGNHRWTLQMATGGGTSPTGTFDIDWVAVYARQ